MMADYILTENPDIIRRTSDGAFIGNDLRVQEWRDYLAWREAGNEPDPAPVLPSMPVALSADDLAAILVKKLILSQSDIQKK
jgi:hypothetical protein